LRPFSYGAWPDFAGCHILLLLQAQRFLAKVQNMLRIPGRYAHFVFGVIQSGLTSGVAAAIASTPFLGESTFMAHWLRSWLFAWAIMIPVAIPAAPAIRRLVYAVTIGAE
jgi:hypothetical protein